MDDFGEKVKKLGERELRMYLSTARWLGILIAIFGIGIVTFCLFVPKFIVVFPSIVLVSFAALMLAGVDAMKTQIKTELKRFG